MRGRWRSFKVVAGTTTLVILTLVLLLLPNGPLRAGRAQERVTRTGPIDNPHLAQKSESRELAVPDVAQDSAETVASLPLAPPSESATDGPPPQEPSLPPLAPAKEASEPPVVAVAAPATINAFSHDPVQSAEAFVARTRKEATDAVEALNKEAAALRERLAKVEAGLARYKATLDAINAGQAHRPAGDDPFRPAGVKGDPGTEPLLEPVAEPTRKRTVPKPPVDRPVTTNPDVFDAPKRSTEPLPPGPQSGDTPKDDSASPR